MYSCTCGRFGAAGGADIHGHGPVSVRQTARLSAARAPAHMPNSTEFSF